MNHLNTLLLAIFVVLFSHSLEINATVSPDGKLKVTVYPWKINPTVMWNLE